MLLAFENGSIRMLVRYFEMTCYNSDGSPKTLTNKPDLVRRENYLSGIELIDLTTKSTITLSAADVKIIASTIEQIESVLPDPININEID